VDRQLAGRANAQQPVSSKLSPPASMDPSTVSAFVPPRAPWRASIIRELRPVSRFAFPGCPQPCSTPPAEGQPVGVRRLHWRRQSSICARMPSRLNGDHGLSSCDGNRSA
jgi:hypothetical protein